MRRGGSSTGGERDRGDRANAGNHNDSTRLLYPEPAYFAGISSSQLEFQTVWEVVAVFPLAGNQYIIYHTTLATIQLVCNKFKTQFTYFV